MRYKKSAAYSEWHNGWIINGHYSKRKYQPWLTKFDIKGRLMDSDMYSVIINLLKGTPHFETMWKKRDKVLCSAFMYGESSQRLWPQIKIALRHGFKFKDWRMWVDHIDMLGREGYDIFNPQYIAPADLKQAHRKLNAEHEERLRKEEEERERIRQLEEIERNKALTDPEQDRKGSRCGCPVREHKHTAVAKYQRLLRRRESPASLRVCEQVLCS